ncbi:MAG: hypothetical protein GXO42_00185 [bacterium]|nr:hypothetical protein [bacterium]
MIVRLAYFGHGYHGFQYQPGRRTVEGELRKYLGSFRYLSRLDAGVSALWQLVKTKHSNFNLNQLNAYLPDDIIIISYSLQNISFKQDVKGKTYLYLVPRSWVLDEQTFKEALRLFVGRHDFDYFRKRDARREVDTVCEIYSIDVRETGWCYEVYVSGNRFLWQMVRRLVGAALLASKGKLTLEDIKAALQKEKRVRQYTAPGEFLILYSVEFTRPVQFYEIEYKWKLRKLEKRFLLGAAFCRWYCLLTGASRCTL